jgi:hypothetical protein
MKKLFFITILSCLSCLLVACNVGDKDSQKALIHLPVAMRVDSTDGMVNIPFETEADETSILWVSDQPEIATVNGLGQITVVGDGVVTITATSGKFSSSMRLIATKDKYKDYTRIKSKLEFLFIFSNPENFNSPDKLYVLDTDIDFNGDNISPIGGWDLSNADTPIDPTRQFRATLDGRGYALMNFNIINPISTKVDQSYFGVSLIPFIYDGVVRNLNIINANFSGSGFTGSIAGKIEKGIIENCFVKANIDATLANPGVPSGGIAGIIGSEAIVRNVILDVKVSGGFIYSGFNFGDGSNSNAISKTLDDEDRRYPIRPTAITTNKGDEVEDAALNDFTNSKRINEDEKTSMDNYTISNDAKISVWAIQEGFMPFLIRKDGKSPTWAKIS